MSIFKHTKKGCIMNYLFLIKNIRRIAPATAAAKMATTAPTMVAVPVKSKNTSLDV